MTAPDLQADRAAGSQPVPPAQREPSAAALARQDAARLTAAAYSGGLDLDSIQARQEDLTARLASDAQTEHGRQYAREYGQAARSLISDLRADADAAAGRTPEGKAPMAASLPAGTPHADPALAAKGWHSNGRVYVRSEPQQELDREAG